MAAQSEGGGKDDIKTHFVTREGTYKLMNLSEYSRPNSNRVPFNSPGNTPVKVSFISVVDPSGAGDRICFNIGKELYFYVYKGVRKAADLTKPIDKRVYKGSFPTCHDFNTLTASSDSVMLLVGFSAGQVQLIDLARRQELSRLYNEERQIDKSKVTCIKWLPGTSNQFLVSHASGQMYVYNEELPSGATPPHYQLFKQGDGYSVYTCKTKSTRNPLYRWVIGEGGISEFAFSPCCKYLAVVTQDGFLWVFDYHSMELVGTMKSYFGGLLCVCWSPDSKYIVTGGEDDLVTVWSLTEKRVVCRGQGHKSWVNVVAFDPYTTSYCETDGLDLTGSDEDFIFCHRNNRSFMPDALIGASQSNPSSRSRHTSSDSRMGSMVSYRFGSVGQDTVLCLWDLTEDVLRQPVGRHRTSTLLSQNSYRGNHSKPNSVPNSTFNSISKLPLADGNLHNNTSTPHITVSTSLTHKFATLALGDKKEKEQEKKEHKRNFSLASRSSDKVPMLKTNHVKPADDSIRLLGTPACPRLDQVPLLEPLVCKKIAHERLTSIVFKEECLVTACQEGFVCTWARPGKVSLAQQCAAASPQQNTGSTAL